MHSQQKRLCPLCKTVLTEEGYAKAIGVWEAQQLHQKHLKQEAEKLRQAQDQLKREKEELIRQQRKEMAIALERQRIRIQQSFQKTVQAEVEKNVKKEKAALRQSEQQLAKQSARMKQYEERMARLTEQAGKQNEEIQRLKDQIEHGTTPQIDGLLEEKKLLEHLRKLFPDDKFNHMGKGGDILQTVYSRSKPVGVIVYECKRVKKFLHAYVAQANAARHKHDADYGVLVTNTFPSQKKLYYVERDVFVISPVCIEPVIFTLRDSLIRMAALRLTAEAKQKAVQGVCNYLSGGQYASKINRIGNELLDLAGCLKEEMKFHKRVWQRRYNSYATIFEDVGTIDGRLHEIVSGLPNGQAKSLREATPLALPYPKVSEVH